jgi:hypothetical protein
MPFEALFSACGLCALVDISALAIMILDPLYRSMSMAIAAAVAIRPQLWSRQRATPHAPSWALKPTDTIGIANGSGKRSDNCPRINS